MHDPGDQRLARSALAGQQHRRRGARRDTGDQVPQADDGRRRPDNPLEAVRTSRVGAESPHLPAETRCLERAFDRSHHLVEIERLGREVVCRELDRLGRGLEAGRRRQQNHQDVRIERLDLSQDRQAIGIGQRIGEEDEVDTVDDLIERRPARPGLDDLIPLGLQPFGQRPADRSLVVHDEDCGF